MAGVLQHPAELGAEGAALSSLAAAGDVQCMRDVMERELRAMDQEGNPHPSLFRVIMPSRRLSDATDEDKRAMVKFLVKETGADIWAEVCGTYWEETTIDDGGRVAGVEKVEKSHTYLPLHAAASMGNKPVLDYFLTECRMLVNTCTPESLRTALHFLVSSDGEEMASLSVIKWLVEEKGADVTRLNAGGFDAAQLAFLSGKTDIRHYLEGQQRQQAARKANEEEEEERKKKAPRTATGLKITEYLKRQAARDLKKDGKADSRELNVQEARQAAQKAKGEEEERKKRMARAAVLLEEQKKRQAERKAKAKEEEEAGKKKAAATASTAALRLEEQEKRQAARKAKAKEEKEEDRKKKAAAAAMAELHSKYKKNRAAEFKAQKEKEAADKKKEEDEYLAAFRSKRRIKIKKERRTVYEDAGLSLEVYRGKEIPDSYFDDDTIFKLYVSTIDKLIYGRQFLNEEFFRMLKEKFREPLCLVIAKDAQGESVHTSAIKRNMYEIKS